ncbi:hypothetical protein C1878_00050 [Gordonibacter sp. 28C]|uniref:hypothetical protein n=1 Tax=Gordonibacter sp. 28C TaxID=2078569 RepID=UPI000DF86398|nr:hypothetical protein [Gordonibacter sp. 28C]RDB64300.1 hypothetical protein C1878_00050 [Gordonibacter sp. 28C]
MVRGLDIFRKWFADYQSRYVVIGGTACNLVFAQYGAPERATHDIDMVIVAEAFDQEFYKRFVSFVREGDYRNKSKADKYVLYRFENPNMEDFPPKIELLSKRPEYLEGIEADLGRLRTIDAAGSLSAILLDDEYYELLERGIEEIDGLPVLGLHYLPVFKIHAWANLTRDKTEGKSVHSDEINKHRRDVLRLCALFEPGTRVELPSSIVDEVLRFVEARPWDDNMMRNLGLRVTAEDMAELIASSYVRS